MATTVEHETAIDYAETARLATEAFASPDAIILPDRLQWFYERCFSLGATIIALREGSRKVGQIAMVRQTVMLDGREESAAQLVDLFVTKEFRGKARLYQLYGEVERQFRVQDIRFAIGMPNAKALGVNEHFFDLKPHLRLPLSMGVATPFPKPRRLGSFRFDPLDEAGMKSLFSQYRTSRDENGLPWNEASLFERLCGHKYQYGIHMLDGLLLISSPRQTRGVSYTLLCGFLTRPGAGVTGAEMRATVRDACSMWRHRLFVYAGINDSLPSLPGFQLPAKARPSPMLLQLRDFRPERAPFRLDRFQLLDFDFA